MNNDINKYKAGDQVTASENPKRRLVVRRYVDRIYYCRDETLPESSDLVYFERDLVLAK